MRASEKGRDSDNGPAAGVYSFVKLEFYQAARSLAVDIFKIAKKLPKDDPTRVVTRQLVASATSIRANIAEGHGRYSRAAYRNHLSIARGSAAETQDWIDLLASVDLLDPEVSRGLTARCDRIIASLTRAMQRLATQPKTNRIGEEPAKYGDEPGFELADDDLAEDAPMLSSSHAQEEESHDYIP